MKAHHVLAAATIASLLALGGATAQAQKAKAPKPMPHMTKVDKAADKQEDKQEQAARKADERAEKQAKNDLKDQPKALLRRIKLTREEKRHEKAIEKKYADELKALEKQEDAAEKSGSPMADVAQKIDALRDEERSDLRATLTPAQQAQFDANEAKLGAKH